jgi:GMP synthase (glutamine-hydrolysing)
MIKNEKILILDFGSQYTQLIARRIREMNVFSEIYSHDISAEKIHDLNPAGIIISGGPMSVYDKDAITIDEKIFSLNIPVLGICYGLQLICKIFNGEVNPSSNREYGKAIVEIFDHSNLFKDVSNKTTVWMSHGDYVTNLPHGFNVTSSTKSSPVCSIENSGKKIFGVQFHPEVMHTTEGSKILSNFIFNICHCKGDWTPENFIETKISEIKEKVGDKSVICALSGGVDSTVAAVLVKQAIGDKLTCIHIDSGLMRKDESAEVVKLFKDKLTLKVIHVDASEFFLSRLNNVDSPEEKRKIIGKTFIDVFEEKAKQITDAEFLVQGTLYPDVIESKSVKGKSVTIKTHHNVGGLPEKMDLKLIEPFRELFKDEVRQIGRKLGIADEFLERHPFPGPGLAVRILGSVTNQRLAILREADKIFIDELISKNLYNEIWQAFAVLLPVQTVGVMGDSRTYENVLALRAVTSGDGMTADWYRFDNNFLDEVSRLITSKVQGINRVVYDITSKPPATIEWE